MERRDGLKRTGLAATALDGDVKDYGSMENYIREGLASTEDELKGLTDSLLD